MNLDTQVLIIIFAPLFALLMFQLSSYLNMTILSTGMAVMEIEDFSKLTGIEESRIRMIYKGNNKVLFKVMSEDEKTELSEALFDFELIKIIDTKNIDIDHNKFLELRARKFAGIIKIPAEKIKISPDGNTFTNIDINDKNEEVILGSITLDEEGIAKEADGVFKKYL